MLSESIYGTNRASIVYNVVPTIFLTNQIMKPSALEDQRSLTVAGQENTKEKLYDTRMPREAELM